MVKRLTRQSPIINWKKKVRRLFDKKHTTRNIITLR